jgi:hypothetical protein
VDDVYDMSLLEDMAGYESEKGRAPGLLPIEKSICDQVIYDSGVEPDFAEALEAMDEVKLFAKRHGLDRINRIDRMGESGNGQGG